MTAFKAAVVVEAGALVAAAADGFNVYLNVFAIALIIYAAIRAGNQRRKDETIRDLEEALKAKTALAEERAESLRQLEQGSQHLKTEVAEWRARYEEQAKYTAESAVARFEQLLEEHRAQVAERHGQLLAQGQEMAVAMKEIAAILRPTEPP